MDRILITIIVKDFLNWSLKHKAKILIMFIESLVLGSLVGLFIESIIKEKYELAICIGICFSIIFLILLYSEFRLDIKKEKIEKKDKLLKIIGGKEGNDTLLSQFNDNSIHKLLSITSGVFSNDLQQCYSQRFDFLLGLFFDIRDKKIKNNNYEDIVSDFGRYFKEYHSLCREIYTKLNDTQYKDDNQKKNTKHKWSEFKDEYNLIRLKIIDLLPSSTRVSECERFEDLTVQ